MTAPPSRLGFVAMMCIMAGCCLLIGLHDLYEASRYWIHGAKGFVESSDPDLPKAIQNGLTYPTVDLTYVTPAGNVEVAQRPIPADLARMINAHQRVPVYFLKNRPQEAYFGPDHPEQPWAYLVIGVGLVFGARYAVRLYKREMGGG